MGDMLVQLRLISKIHGFEEAEKYFYSLSDNRRLHLFDTLLNYHEDHQHLKEAEAMMQTMQTTRMEVGYSKALAACLGGLKCQGDVEAEK